MLQSTMFVAARHTVMAGTPQRAHGPGELVTLDAAEAEHLAAAGFLQSDPPVLPASDAASNPANIGVQGGNDVQGPLYR